MITNEAFQAAILLTVIFTIAALSRWRGRREAEAVAAEKIAALQAENDDLTDQLIALAARRHPSRWDA